MLKNIVFILFLSFSVPSLAQVGRSFWFVVPGLMHDHGVNPILFRITAFDKPANVTISMPANPAFNPYSLFIGANKQVNYNLNTSVSEIFRPQR
jgi:hypothetical protein